MDQKQKLSVVDESGDCNDFSSRWERRFRDGKCFLAGFIAAFSAIGTLVAILRMLK